MLLQCLDISKIKTETCLHKENPFKYLVMEALGYKFRTYFCKGFWVILSMLMENKKKL